MKIGVINGSSQRERNRLLYELTQEAAKGNEVINFGCFGDETEAVSYFEASLLAGLLLGSGAVDFIVTGCSSGQGMMLACNALPGVLCGYAPTPQDAFLFARINGGNAVSLPLGLNFGWAGEINLKLTLKAVFDGEFGVGYPPEEAERKREDTRRLHALYAQAKKPLCEIFDALEPQTVTKALSRKCVTEYVLKYGTDPLILNWLRGRII